jgi:thiamine-phosphate pyrophosphorylase
LFTLKACRKTATLDKRPLLYYITDRRQLAGASLKKCIRRALDLGVDFIQIREKDLHDRALFELTRYAVSMARGTSCRILVNGRADVAMAAGAQGVHLPTSGLKIPDIRPWLPRDFFVGVSVHTMREIRAACTQKADYVLLGHVLHTESKSAYGPCLGLDYLRKACSESSVPVFGLGGMKPEFICSVFQAGAVGIAGISLFQNKDEFSRLKKMINPMMRKSSGLKNPSGI